MTQKYEPVEWTDETPTQPGTLINKARMDQMQSAHHFADGFEEVDAIPTEDPGTEYHKVVYCTADSTFYRWDGTQWTADIDDDTRRLLEEHEADHANPHQVTKAQVGLGNADNTSDADKPISTATAAALAGKAEDSTVVHLTGAETIDGKKTFTKNPVVSGAPPALTLINTLDTWVSPPSADAYASIGFSDKDNVAVGNVGTVHKTGTGERRTYLSARTSGGSVTAELDVVISSDGNTKYATAPARAYNTANEDDLVTIGTLKQSTDVVHRSGDETISGNKTFMADANNNFLLKGETALGGEMKIGSAATGSDPLGQIEFVKLPTLATVAEIGSDAAGLLTLSGSTAVTIRNQRAYNASNTDDVVTIGTLATPLTLKANDNTVVHLTGDEVLSNGVKANTTAGSSSERAMKDVPPRFVVQSTGFDRTALQGFNRHYPVAGLNDKNGKPVAKLSISTTDTIINTYLQAIGIDETQATLKLAKFDRATHTWEPTMANNALDAYLPMVRTSGDQEISGTKRFTGRILNRVCYVKNTTGAENPVPIFRLSPATKNDKYVKMVLFMGGRTTPTSITEVTWNNTTLTKVDIVGSQSKPFSIMADTSGNYWLCVTIVANNTVNAFEMMALRNAGFDEPVWPIFQGETPDMTGWTTVVAQT